MYSYIYVTDSNHFKANGFDYFVVAKTREKIGELIIDYISNLIAYEKNTANTQNKALCDMLDCAKNKDVDKLMKMWDEYVKNQYKYNILCHEINSISLT